MEKTVISLNKDWQFSRGGELNSSEAEMVCLPHTVELTPANSSGCRNYQGACVYSKAIFIPEEYRGKKLFLEFEGAMGVSVLFINGEKVNEHYCGYTPLKVYDLNGNFIGEQNITANTVFVARSDRTYRFYVANRASSNKGTIEWILKTFADMSIKDMTEAQAAQYSSYTVVESI